MILHVRPDTAIALTDLLRAKLPSALDKDISNSKIRRLIVAGAVSINGAQCRNPSVRVRAGASVTVRIDREKLFYEKPTHDIAFTLTRRDVLFEDDFLIVVNKPAFFPTEAGMVQSRDNLHAAVVRYLTAQTQARNPCYAGTVHRLDRETSGAIVFAKTRSVNAACHALFESRAVQKTYRAVVCAAAVDSIGQREQTFSVEMYMGRG